MQKEENKKNETSGDQSENIPDYIQEFIERKRLENRILQGIIDNISHAQPIVELKKNKKKPKA
jgi:hypothetical protein